MLTTVGAEKVVIISATDSFLAKSMMTKLKEANVSSSFVHAQIKEIEEHLDTMELAILFMTDELCELP